MTNPRMIQKIEQYHTQNLAHISHYFRESGKTATYNQNIREAFGIVPFLPLTYPIFKLVGELGEYAIAMSGTDTHLQITELGDCFWYVFALHRDFDLGIPRINPTQLNFEEMVREFDTPHVLTVIVAATQLSECAGKLFRDAVKGEERINALMKKMKLLVRQIYALLLGEAQAFEIVTLEDIFQINLDKLSGRKAAGTLEGDGEGVLRAG